MAKGALYYAASASAVDIYGVTIDFGAARVTDGPTSLGERFIGGAGNRWFATWSHRGDTLAFINVDRSGAAASIPIRNVTSGDLRVVPFELTFARELKWAVDDQSFFLAGVDRKGQQGLFRIDAKTGQTTPIVVGYLIRDVAAAPDGHTIYYEQRGGGRSGVYVRDLERGEERELFKGLVGGLDLSPDGNTLALFGNFGSVDGPIDGITLMPANGGEMRVLFTARNATTDRINYLRWSGDGKHLVFVRGQELNDVWTLAIDSGEAKATGIKLDGIRNISINRANRLAIAAGIIKLEMWMLEGLMPPSGAAQKN
jgi:Tol biopolymer transport system component